MSPPKKRAARGRSPWLEQLRSKHVLENIVTIVAGVFLAGTFLLIAGILFSVPLSECYVTECERFLVGCVFAGSVRV